MRPKGETVPAEHPETVRRAIREILEERAVSAREISGEVRVPEKEVAEHLEHLRRSLHGTGRRLELVPPECRSCGFVFRKRERLTKPGKCPACGGTYIREPLFEIR